MDTDADHIRPCTRGSVNHHASILIVKNRPAFTIIEILACIGIIVVLVSLLLPVLASVRRGARESQSLSNTRSIAQLMHAYASDWQDAMPFIKAGQKVEVGGGLLASSSSHWFASQFWPGILLDLSSGPNPSYLLSPGPYVDESSTLTSYAYSLCFSGAPALWDGTGVQGDQYLRAIRLSEVRFPSKKVLLFDRELRYRSRPLSRLGDDLSIPSPAALADASGLLAIQSNATPPALNVMIGGGTLSTERWHNTPNGVHGTDNP